jgi:four helix bundle protein
MSVKSHRELRVWQRSLDLAEAIYKVTTRFPDSEKFGLTSQMRRAAVSVPSNIAEAFYRLTARDYASFLSIAKGSLMELQTQLMLAGRLKFLSKEPLDNMLATISDLEYMIAALRNKVMSASSSTRRNQSAEIDQTQLTDIGKQA